MVVLETSLESLWNPTKSQLQVLEFASAFTLQLLGSIVLSGLKRIKIIHICLVYFIIIPYMHYVYIYKANKELIQLNSPKTPIIRPRWNHITY